MNWLKIIGIILIVFASYGLLKIVSDYLSGEIGFWPVGAEIGSGLVIWLGLFLIKGGNKQKSKFHQ